MVSWCDELSFVIISSPDEHAGASVARRASSLSAMPSKTSIKISSHLLIEMFFFSILVSLFLFT